MRVLINGNPLEWAGDKAKEAAKEQVQEWIAGALEAIREFVVDASFSIALIGSGICLLFWVAGWKDGKRWTGILILAWVLIRFLLGGAA